MQNKSGKGTNFVPVISNWDVDGLFMPSAGTARMARGRGSQGNNRPCRGNAKPNCADAPCAVQVGDVCPVNPPCAETAQPCNVQPCQAKPCAAQPCPAQAYPTQPCSAQACAAQPCQAEETARCTCGAKGAQPCAACAANAACPRPAANPAVGMVYAAWQTLADVFEAESALLAGTLFPELHKPLNGYGPCGGNCATYQQAAAFAVWELRLYLNTHPNDQRALALFQRLMAQAADPNYATAFLEADYAAMGWTWVNDPWPWEYDCNCAN